MEWRQDLVNAQTEVCRAVNEMNRPGDVPPQKIEPRYLLLCIEEAISDLSKSAEALRTQGIKAFTAREMRKWRRR